MVLIELLTIAVAMSSNSLRAHEQLARVCSPNPFRLT